MVNKIEFLVKEQGTLPNCTIGNRCTRRGKFKITIGNQVKQACYSHARRFADKHNLKMPKGTEE